MSRPTLNEIDLVIKELGCKSVAKDIPRSDILAVYAFLKQEREIRHINRIARLLTSCGISKPQIRTFEQFDWGFNHKLPKEDVISFRQSDWIATPANLLLIGDPGTGKSHIAKALCYDAIQEGATTCFISAFDLLNKIKKAQYPDSRINYFATRVKVLCIDELGYVVHKKEDTDLLFQIISKRAELAPTIITTNLRPKQWGSIFSGPAASAILDRLSLNGFFLTYEGPSYRNSKKRK